MANQAFGAGTGTGAPGAAEFGDLARQYWATWERMMGAAAPSPAPAQAPWSDPSAWWAAATGARPNMAGGMDPGLFGQQASGWFAQVQQLASRFAGREASAADVASAWRQMLAANPLAQGVGVAMPGLSGGMGWPSTAQLLQSWQQQAQALLGLPAFGFAREHQERWQALAAAQLEAQQATAAYNELMAQATQDALGRFEKALSARSEPGRQLESARALFDLWVDVAEEAYAESALSPRFREVYGAMVNAQMRLRGKLQREIEEIAGSFGLPTRTEVDAAHRKTVQLEREMRRLRDAVEALRAAGGSAAETADATASPGRGAGNPGQERARPAAASGKAAAAPAKSHGRGQAAAPPAKTKTPASSARKRK